FAAHVVIELPRDRRAAARDQMRDGQPRNRRQADNGRIAKKILQERRYRLRAIRSTQIEQDDGQLHPRIRLSNCSTWAIGVSGRMPWPRLKICGLPFMAVRISSTARSSAAPPAIRVMGSRLPCTAQP